MTYYMITAQHFGATWYAGDVRDDGSVTRWSVTPSGVCCWSQEDALELVRLASARYAKTTFEAVPIGETRDVAGAGGLDVVPDHGVWPSGRKN